MATSTTKKVIIRVIVILFLISSGLTFVLYLMAPSEQPSDDSQPINLEEYLDLEAVDLIFPSNEDIDVNNPENNDIQIIITENEDQDEMSQVLEIDMGDGAIDTPTVGDFSDSLQYLQ